MATWTTPYNVICEACGKIAEGSLGLNKVGEPVDCAPPGWRQRVSYGSTIWACCALCADDYDKLAQE
jgi:hypothetical protein